MTRRKPTDMSFVDWNERQIREAQDRGAFDDLPGAGKPIPDLDRPWSAERWAADLARREGVDLSLTLPPSLRLRRERERLLAGVADLDREEQVRAAVEVFNDAVREAVRRPVTGPPLTVGLMAVEDVVQRWREDRQARAAEAPAVPEPDPAPPERARRRWFGRGR
ncbi:DUF1992 domain-containing protein [Jannaschia sp. R86511]|uniref:DnaJ family domain-containing protein n=1 Tax=Jannaschia sp. R86511 TaxID=3093853 RepID=UPI0036D30EAD